MLLGRAPRALLTLFVVSPLAREGGRRSASSLCMASGSTAWQPGWVTLIDESIKKNDVAHKNFGESTPLDAPRRSRPRAPAPRVPALLIPQPVATPRLHSLTAADELRLPTTARRRDRRDTKMKLTDAYPRASATCHGD